MLTSKRPERLVVDAHPILSALLGGKARRTFFEAGTQEFAVPAAVLREVRDHLPELALKLDTPRPLLEYALDLLPLEAYAARGYQRHLREAHRRIGHRDPDDSEVLALALHLRVPIWTNDRDFESAGVHCLTTARLLTLFFGPSIRS